MGKIVISVIFIIIFRLSVPVAEGSDKFSIEIFSSTKHVTSIVKLYSSCLVGTSGGLIIAEKGTRKKLLPGIFINSMMKMGEDVFIASRSGLYLYKNNSLQLLNELPVYSVAMKDGSLITGHISGIIYAGNKKIQLPSKNPVQFLAFHKDILFAATVDELWSIKDGNISKEKFSKEKWENITCLENPGDILYVGTPTGLFFLKEDKWGEVKSTKDIQINSICQAGDNIILGGDGLYLLSGDKVRLLRQSPYYITAVKYVKGTILAGTDNDGLWCFNIKSDNITGTYKLYGTDNEPPGNDITSLSYNGGTLFVGTFENGLGIYSRGKWKTVTEKEGLHSNWINQLGNDGKRFYVRFSDGLVYLYENNIWRQAGKKKDGWPKDWTVRIGNDRANLWVGTESAFYIYEKGWEFFVPKPELTGESITDISLNNDEIWIGTHKDGLFLWNRKENTWEHFTLPLMPDSWITNVEIFNGELWAGTFNHGLCRFTENKEWKFYSPPGLPSGSINCMLWTEKFLWIGTLEGLVRTDGSQWQVFTRKDGLPSDSIRELATDGQNLWIGTDDGLCSMSMNNE